MNYFVVLAFWADSDAVHVIGRHVNPDAIEPWGYSAEQEGNGGMPLCVVFVPLIDENEPWDGALESVEDVFRRLLGKEPGPWVPNTDERNQIKVKVG